MGVVLAGGVEVCGVAFGPPPPRQAVRDKATAMVLIVAMILIARIGPEVVCAVMK
jgi:hypothetical protein